jgi:malonate decarboxylase beta subunit
LQNITPQFDDGCIIVRGRIDDVPAVVVAIEGAYQGGSIGEVSGAKISTALDLARRDNESGVRTNVVLLLESGGVRLQEANLGLAAVAEILGSILTLRIYVPVICVIAGPVGCFGGMSLAAGLASYVVMTREGRLGMNGPGVIEQEAGVEEFDSNDKSLIWAIDGGAQRLRTGLIDALVEDDVEEVRRTVRDFLRKGNPAVFRSQQAKLFREKIALLDPSKQWHPSELPSGWFEDKVGDKDL